MPVAIQCTGCKQRLRVPDKVAGKRIKCPKCQTVLRVPKPEQPQDAEERPARKQPAEAHPEADTETPDRWYLKTEDGDDYGPVSKAELDEWMEEGRITAECHVLRHGDDQWQWASDVYPELESDEATASPAGPPPLRTSPAAPTTRVSVSIPTVDDSPPAAPEAFQFAADDTSPTLRARGRKRVRKAVKKGPATKSAAAHPTPPSPQETSPKSKMVAGLLGIFLGAYGVHRFYLGYTSIGLLMLVTCGGCGIWALIDAIMILLGKVPDAQGRPLRD